MLPSQSGAFFGSKNDKCFGVESQTSEIVPSPFASLPQARRPLLRTEHIQKRRKAKSLDGTYTRSLRMVKNIFWKDKQNTCKGCKRELVRQLPT